MRRTTIHPRSAAAGLGIAKPPRMTPKRFARAALLLSAAGTAFSGYLSAKRMLSGMCAFDESCPFFLGRPACYYGFTLFLSLFAVALFANVTRTEGAWPPIASIVLASGGVAFASAMTALDAHVGVHHPLLLPTCAWGLVFFAAMLAISIAALLGRLRSHAVTV
jgi:hypothetical protein